MECNCGKDLAALHISNREKHLKTCGVKRKSKSITSYFSSAKKSRDISDGNSVDEVGESSTSSNIVDGTDMLSGGTTKSSLDTVDIDCMIHHRQKCSGFVLSLIKKDDIYSHFPFTLIPQLNIVFENGRFHTSQCALNGYDVHESEPATPTINKSCSMLAHSPPFLKVLENMNNDNYYKTHAKNINMSHKQLGQRSNNY